MLSTSNTNIGAVTLRRQIKRCIFTKKSNRENRANYGFHEQKQFQWIAFSSCNLDWDVVVSLRWPK
jgi:hypothetical protein